MHATLVFRQALDEAAVECLFDSLRLHGVLLDCKIGSRPPAIIHGQILLGQLAAHTRLALLNDTVLVVSAGPHLSVELCAGNLVLPLKVGHLLASLCVFNSDSALVNTEDNLFASFLHPIDNHKEEQHADEAVDDLDGQQDVLDSVVELEVLHCVHRISLCLVLVHSFEVTEERLGHWAISRAGIGRLSRQVMRWRVQPLVALNLLLRAVTKNLVQAEDDLNKLESVGHFAESPMAASRDDDALANG